MSKSKLQEFSYTGSSDLHCTQPLNGKMLNRIQIFLITAVGLKKQET